MNFRPKAKNKPELNLIPLIDVLIVLLIFLVLTTTFSREAALHINLPETSAEVEDKDKGIELVISRQGQYTINGRQVVNTQEETLKKALLEAAGENKNPLVTVSADKLSAHQSLMVALDAAAQVGFTHISFASKKAVEK